MAYRQLSAAAAKSAAIENGNNGYESGINNGVAMAAGEMA